MVHSWSDIGGLLVVVGLILGPLTPTVDCQGVAVEQDRCTKAGVDGDGGIPSPLARPWTGGMPESLAGSSTTGGGGAISAVAAQGTQVSWSAAPTAGATTVIVPRSTTTGGGSIPSTAGGGGGSVPADRRPISGRAAYGPGGGGVVPSLRAGERTVMDVCPVGLSGAGGGGSIVPPSSRIRHGSDGGGAVPTTALGEVAASAGGGGDSGGGAIPGATPVAVQTLSRAQTSSGATGRAGVMPMHHLPPSGSDGGGGVPAGVARESSGDGSGGVPSTGTTIRVRLQWLIEGVRVERLVTIEMADSGVWVVRDAVSMEFGA